MSKSFKEAFKHTKKDSQSLKSLIWVIMNFAWLCYCTYRIKGTEATAGVITEKIFLGLIPFVVGGVLLFTYHYLRSDLYIEKGKPILGNSLITGKLLSMVEFWQEKPIGRLGSSPEYSAYCKLRAYRTSYEFDSIHEKIDVFLSHFLIGGNRLFPEISTTFESKESAMKNFDSLKELSKAINKVIT